MKSLYLRIYLTVVAVLLAFALVGGWLAQRQMEQEREQFETNQEERLQAMAVLLQRALPGAQAPAHEQALALRQWSQQLRLPLALEDAQGQRLATTGRFERLLEQHGSGALQNLPLSDGRRLLLLRPWRARGTQMLPPGWGGARGVHALVGLFLLLFVAVALGAYPVVRRLTRRLEALKLGVERLGAGDLSYRVEVDGRDEVAALARSFNDSAQRVASLLQAHQSLVANASHELRSPLARLKMALALRDAIAIETPKLDARSWQRNLNELDALLEELLLSARHGGGRAG